MAAGTMTFTRTYVTPPERLWELWTTKPGIESWWGPDGFEVTVDELDLRAGGELRYTMTATGEPQIAFMQGAGLPLATTTSVSFTDVIPNQRLGFVTRADFIPGVGPYDVHTVVELVEDGDATDMTITVDTMHDADWTERSRMGEEGQLEKLDALLAK